MATTQTQLKAVSTDEQDDNDELGPREDCWCDGKDLACFGHFQAEREDAR